MALRPDSHFMASADIGVINANRLGTTTFSSDVKLDDRSDVPRVSLSLAHHNEAEDLQLPLGFP